MSSKGTILAVDDTLASLRLLSDTLKGEGYTVRAAQNGELALRSAQAEPPDLILLDIRMPGMDGFEVCRLLKTDHQTAAVPVIFLSATTDTDEKVQGFALGAVDFVSKPFQREELLARVHTQLTLFRLNTRLEALVAERTRELAESEQRFRVLVEQAPDAILVFDLDRDCIVEANPKAEQLWGRDRRMLLTQKPGSLFTATGSKLEGFFAGLHRQQLALAGSEALFECRAHCSDGQEILCEARLVRLPANERRLLRASFTDISERKSSEARIVYLAHHDPLTGLANRVSLQEYMAVQLAEAKQRNHPVAVMMLDLDGFKFVNDALGHQMGDLLLTEVAARLRDSVPPGALVARQGGDEFIVVVANSSRTAVADIATQINLRLAAPCLVEGKRLFTSASIGISLFPDDGSDGNELIRHADMAMYQAKQTARGEAYFFDARMNTLLIDRLALEEDLRTALEEQQFELYYQPKLELSSRRIVGLEALVRWRHPVKGLIPPALFIPVAEQTGRIGALGNWVLREACRQLKEWEGQGIGDLSVSVNLSASQLQDAQLIATVQEVLRDTGLGAHQLDLEITESSAMLSPENAIQVMKKLTALGVSFSIDDFGTGYSSLAYLKQFPIQVLKIDRSFVKDVETNEDDAALCEINTLLARRLGLLTVAEGVETPGQQQFLQGIACDQIQGYWFCPPLPAAQVPVFIKGHVAGSVVMNC